MLHIFDAFSWVLEAFQILLSYLSDFNFKNYPGLLH